MLKRFSHSRGESLDDNASGHSIFHKRTPSTQAAASAAGLGTAAHRRTTSRSSVSSTSSNFLAEQYERDRRGIIQSCFQKVDAVTGLPTNVYITHVRIIEDSRYPSSRPPADSPLTNKKKRVLIVSTRANGLGMQLHKARENSNGTFQIGRSWDLKELMLIERDPERPEGFVFIMGKKYYWETNSAKERLVFIKSIVKIYMENSSGRVPQLINWDLSMFYLDEQSYQRAVIRAKSQPDVPPANAREGASVTTHGPNSMHAGSAVHPSAMNLGMQPGQQAPPQSQFAPPQSKTSFKELSAFSPDPAYAENSSAEVLPHNRPLYVQGHDHNQVPQQVPRQSNVVGGSQSSAHAEAPRPAVQQPNIPTAATHAMAGAHTSAAAVPPTPHQGSHPYSSFYARGRSESGNKTLRISHSPSSARSDVSKTGISPVMPLNVAPEEGQKEDSPYQRPMQENVTPGPAQPAVLGRHKSGTITESRVSFENDRYMEELDGALRSSLDINRDHSPSNTNTPSDEPSPYKKESNTQEVPTAPMLESIRKFPSEMSFGEDDIRPERFAKRDPTSNSSLPTRDEQRAAVTEVSPPETTGSHTDIPENEVLDFQAMVGILDEIHWSANDGSDVVLERLLLKVAEAEYQFNKQLMSLPKKASDLKLYKAKTVQECDRMDPTLSLFTMELSSISKDIEYVESQSNGLQVNCMNKKLLLKDLSGILDSVSLAESSLEELLTVSLVEKNLDKVESLLVGLHKAIGAIKGGKKDEQSDLGEIRALKDRRQAYERITDSFLKKLVSQMDAKFKKMQVCSSNLNELLSGLLVFSSLPLFCKDVSEQTFNVLLDNWSADVCKLYKTRVASVMKYMQERYAKPQQVLSTAGKDELLQLWDTFRKTKTLSFASCTKSDDLDTILKSLGAIEELCITYQNFVDRFFHMSSSLTFPEYVNKFDTKSRQFDLYTVKSMESNRDSAKLKNQMVTTVFQSEFATFFAEVSQVLRKNQWHIPVVLLYLDNRIKWLKPTDQEFLLSAIVKIYEKLKQDWEAYINEQTVHHERAVIDYKAKYLFLPVLNFPIFVKTAEDELAHAFTNFNLSPEHSSDILNYLDETYCMWGASVVKLLGREDKSELGSTKLPPVNHSANLEKCISIVKNSHWFVEILPIFRKDSFLDIIQQSKQVFDKQKESYAVMLLYQEMGELFAFVDGTHGLINSSSAKADPSRWAAYSPQHLNTLLSKYTSQQIDSIVDKMYNNMTQHFSDDAESKMAELLREKLWSCIQGQTVSFYLKLYSLIDRHYKGIHVHFTKNDIISAFEGHKNW
ncbi:AaceriADR012Cp [[Ashbya] aceris (nom. inval.)]|nr:AaceriADR012Cp [[Ashbya] aceris (nom. inval.)]